MPVHPSGEQYELVSGDARATVVEVGGALRTYLVGDREVLDGYGVDEMATAGRGQPLVPWPNRLRDGRYSWDGAEHQTPLSEPDKGNAIHGLVRWDRWACTEQRGDTVTLAHLLYPRPGYPFALHTTITYRLAVAGLTVQTTARNVGAEPLPYGSGQHPYLRATTGRLDAMTLTAPAATYLRTDERSIPTGAEPVDGTGLDLRQGRRIGDLRLDHAFADLRRNGDGQVVVRFVDDTGTGAEVWLDEGYRWLQLFTGDTLADPAQRRRGLAVEPMTCPPNAFATGQDVRRLEPDESVTTTWGIRPLGA